MDPQTQNAATNVNDDPTANTHDAPEGAAAATPEPKGDEAALAALDRGIEEGSDDGSPKAGAKAADDAAISGKPPGDADAKAAAEAKAADAKPGDKAAATKPEPDAAVEAEIKDLRLKEKGAERFRAMASEIKAFAPIKQALEKAGIKDAATFEQAMPQLIQRSKDFEDLVGMVSETGATPEMYTAALDYLKNTHAAAQGDVAAAQRCYEQTLGELKVWAKMLGREVPGVVDPLEGHPDLQAEVEAGDLTRQRALEIVQQRNAVNLHQGRAVRDDQARTAEDARAGGIQALNAVEVKLKAADPDYDRKRAFLLPAVRRIVAKFPPNEWAAETEKAYAEIPALPAHATPPPATQSGARPLPGPVRGGARMAVAAVPKDPMEALDMGIAAASGG